MSPSRSILQVEELGARDLPSAVVVAPSAAAGVALRAVAEPAPTGLARGRYAADLVQSAYGKAVHLRGTAKLDGVGRFTVTGTVYALGYTENGQASGALTFANSHGSFTLEIVGAPQAAFAAPPTQFAFQIVGGAGAYRNLQQDGVLDLKLGRQRSGGFTLTMHAAAETPMASGIRGETLVGPVTPITRRGVPNTRILPGAVISVQSADGAAEIARVAADAFGMFRLALEPGDYLIVPVPTGVEGFQPHGQPQAVHLDPGQILDLNLLYDSGIR